jgi:phytoene dehydrogenase-like protein
MARDYDAVIVGSGPNGLAAGIALAGAGLSTLIVEGAATPGGGARSAELTLPGYVHDVCSTVHPLAYASPFFRLLSLERFGLQPIESPAPVAHVFGRGTVVTLERSLARTAERLGRDAAAYRRLLAPFVEHFDELMAMILGPLRWPAEPLLLARFGLRALRSLRGLARDSLHTPEARALLAGLAAHSMLPLEDVATASFALVLASAGHAVGWPITRGGSRSLVDALVARFRELGGELELGRPVARLSELPRARAFVLDVTPRQFLELAGSDLPAHERRRLERFRYGPGVFKIDWALSEPVPWSNPECARAATVHLGGDYRSVAHSEAAVHAGRVAEHPFVLFVQPSLFDPTRAPPGRHTAWAYCHVPLGSALDMTHAIETEIGRQAPGFREVVLARATKNAREMEAYNPNYVGGDINGGSARFLQSLVRPALRGDPYATALPNVFLCSSSTPPGGGVHGMCGYFAARSALLRVFGRELPPELDIAGARARKAS